MKYVILRCEDDARTGERTASLLEGAKLSHLQHLAQAGAAGTIRHRTGRIPIDRFHLHGAVFGLEPRDPEAAPGRWYAASAGVELAEGERAWCADFLTHQDGRIVDAAAGHIPTKESAILIQALNDQLGS